MQRNDQRSKSYWGGWVRFYTRSIAEEIESIKTPAKVPMIRAHNLFDLARNHWHLMLLRYSRGDSIAELAQYFPGAINYWEQSALLHSELGRPNPVVWGSGLINDYQLSFCLVGMALTFNVPDDQWKQLLALIGNEGEDSLLDRIIATRQIGRKIETTLCYKALR